MKKLYLGLTLALAATSWSAFAKTPAKTMMKPAAKTAASKSATKPAAKMTAKTTRSGKKMTAKKTAHAAMTHHKKAVKGAAMKPGTTRK